MTNGTDAFTPAAPTGRSVVAPPPNFNGPSPSGKRDRPAATTTLPDRDEEFEGPAAAALRELDDAPDDEAAADVVVESESSPDGEVEPAKVKRARSATGQRRWPMRVAVGVIAVLLALVAFGAWRLHTNSQLADARRTALAAGQADAVLISTYAYDKFPEYSKRIVANSTPEFAANYTKSAGSLGSILAQYKAGSKGTVIGAGLGSVSTTKATVYVFLDETVSNTKNPAQSERARMVVTLVRGHGHWIIANAVVE